MDWDKVTNPMVDAAKEMAPEYIKYKYAEMYAFLAVILIPFAGWFLYAIINRFLEIQQVRIYEAKSNLFNENQIGHVTRNFDSNLALLQQKHNAQEDINTDLQRRMLALETHLDELKCRQIILEAKLDDYETLIQLNKPNRDPNEPRPTP